MLGDGFAMDDAKITFLLDDDANAESTNPDPERCIQGLASFFENAIPDHVDIVLLHFGASCLRCRISPVSAESQGLESNEVELCLSHSKILASYIRS